MNKKLLAIAISSALAAPMAAQAVSFQVSGHVNRAIMFLDDGIDSDVQHVDNGASRTRVTITGSDNLGVGGIKAGVRMEWSVASNLSSNVTIKSRGGNTGGQDLAFDIRHSALWFSGNWGRLTMGHTSGAYDGNSFADQSGSVFLAGIENGMTTFGGAVRFRTSTGGNTGTTLGQAFSSFDGGRYDLIRYDTPNFGPFSAGVAVGDNQRWDIGGRLNTSFSGARIAARIGYEDREGDNGTSTYGGSISVLFSQGTNLTLAYAEQEIRGRTGPGSGAGPTAAFNVFGNQVRDADNLYIKLGHRWGNNSVAIDYGETDDLARANDEATSWGIGIAHDIPGPNVQLYAGYRNFDLDRPGVNVEDVDSFNVGTRVRF